MIEEAAKANFQWYPNPALEKRLKDFIGMECRNFATKRNNIAHDVVDLRFSDPPRLKIGYWLVPSLYASKKNPLKGPNAYAYMYGNSSSTAVGRGSLAPKMAIHRLFSWSIPGSRNQPLQMPMALRAQ